jgi:hypothetical protein
MGRNIARETYFSVPYENVITCGNKFGTKERSCMQSPKTPPPLLRSDLCEFCPIVIFQSKNKMIEQQPPYKAQPRIM